MSFDCHRVLFTVLLPYNKSLHPDVSAVQAFGYG